MNEIPTFSDDAIIPELQRQLNLAPELRPFLGVLTNDIENPEHTGGIEYVPVTLETLASVLGEKGELKSITATFKMRLEESVALISATWPPLEPQGKSPLQHIIKIMIYATPEAA